MTRIPNREELAGGAYGNMRNVYAGTGHIGEAIDMKHDGQLRWTIEDDGAGRHAPKAPPAEGTPTKKTSLGTAITRARLDLVQKQHGGKAGFHYTDLPQGTRVEVDMPLLSAFG